jgi:hypothetical protein
MNRRNFITSIFAASLLSPIIKQPSFEYGGIIKNNDVVLIGRSKGHEYIIPFDSPPVHFNCRCSGGFIIPDELNKIISAETIRNSTAVLR